MHRLRIKFDRGNELKYLSHLDWMRLWDRALRRAGLPSAYSEGFSPHPHISFASPLAVGFISDAEIMDIFFAHRISPDTFIRKVRPQVPPGINIIEVFPVNPQAPSLQSSLRMAEYEVEIETDLSPEKTIDGINRLLASEKIPWHHSRDTGERFYDLRPLIDDVWMAEITAEKVKIGMRLRCDALGTGRPEQVIKALGYQGFPTSIKRTKLIFNDTDRRGG